MGKCHSVSYFRCGLCGLSSNQRWSLKRHLTRLHKNVDSSKFNDYVIEIEPAFKCSLCSYRGEDLASLHKHKKKKHGLKIQFKQSSWRAKFLLPSQLWSVLCCNLWLCKMKQTGDVRITVFFFYLRCFELGACAAKRFRLLTTRCHGYQAWGNLSDPCFLSYFLLLWMELF